MFQSQWTAVVSRRRQSVSQGVTTDTGLDQTEDPEDCLSGSRFSSVV